MVERWGVKEKVTGVIEDAKEKVLWPPRAVMAHANSRFLDFARSSALRMFSLRSE